MKFAVYFADNDFVNTLLPFFKYLHDYLEYFNPEKLTKQNLKRLILECLPAFYLLRQKCAFDVDADYLESGIAPYSCGLICDEAKVPCEHIYRDRDEAVSDREKLSRVNPVGFDIVRCARLKPRRKSYSFLWVIKTYLSAGLIKKKVII